MSGSRILITGGASGLGQALAYCIAKQGGLSANTRQDTQVKVCIADVNQQRAEETVEKLIQQGAEAFYFPCDITRDDSVEKLRLTIHEKWGGIDMLVNNAGVATGGSFQSESIEQWQWVFEVNLLGMVRVSQAFIEGFKQQGHGKILNIASQAGLTPIPLMTSYNATKAAVVSLSETMRLEFAPFNVDVSVACPAFFKTHLGESIRTTEPVVKDLLTKFVEKATLTSEDVAQRIIRQVEKSNFLIITHSEGIKVYLLKKLLPRSWYLKIMQTQIKGILARSRKESNKNSESQAEGQV